MDEAWFYRTRFANSENMRIWSTQKPYEEFLYIQHPNKIRCDQLKNKSSRRVTYGNPCYNRSQR
jgi:hypothetical protein